MGHDYDKIALAQDFASVQWFPVGEPPGAAQGKVGR